VRGLVLNRSGTQASPGQTPQGLIGAGLRKFGARSVSSYLPRLTRKAFEKYGFASSALLTDWASIVGKDLARYTAPERMRWPRGADSSGEAEAHGRPVATLVVRVDGPRAIELQHRAQQLIERINTAFGYRAVAELRFVQAPLPEMRPEASTGHPSAPGRRRSPDLASVELAGVRSDALRAALARLRANLGPDHSG
jgi:hypothetical protein